MTRAKDTTLEMVYNTIKDCTGRTDIQTGLNGWPTVDAVADEMGYGHSHTLKCVNHLADEDRVTTAKSVHAVPSARQSTEITTVAVTGDESAGGDGDA
jgi:hypothetical protein